MREHPVYFRSALGSYPTASLVDLLYNFPHLYILVLHSMFLEILCHLFRQSRQNMVRKALYRELSQHRVGNKSGTLQRKQHSQQLRGSELVVSSSESRDFNFLQQQRL